MCLNDLYRQYGELLISAEITQAKINACKQQIADELNKQATSASVVGPYETNGVDTRVEG